MRALIDMEDPDIVVDLRHHNHGMQPKYEEFWVECEKFLNEDIGLAVDDRRHGEITHLARAISVRDLRDQVISRLPPDANIPSIEWIRLQFWPKGSSLASLQHTGRFKVRYMVQQRQFCRDHCDAHYAAAIFRYMREYALMFKEYSLFLCLDDKHRISVGEPHFPVATAERGRRVLVANEERLVVGDHDFTTCSIIPSVILLVSIPEAISESWYEGQVFVGLKDASFEPSSPVRHMTELFRVLEVNSLAHNLPIVFIYTDGGPDHRLTFISVQISLICLFLKMDLDYLCAARTAPYHSWRNPVERIMSIVNLGLQSVGVARQQMGDEVEAELKKCSSLADLRKLAERNPQIVSAVRDSLSPVKIQLTKIMERLQLKGTNFKVFTAATKDDIDSFWAALLALDATLNFDHKITRHSLNDHAKVTEFILHCCQSSHYAFDILKCGKSDCKICKPVRLPKDVFANLHHIPHPMPGPDNHYMPFSEIFGKPSTEEHRPSATTKRPKKSVPIPTSKQHALNTNLMVECEQCGMWRLVYSAKKLSICQRNSLQRTLDKYTYSCGAELSDLNLDGFPLVYVRHVQCHDPIERLYYSAGYPPICIYCGKDQSPTNSSFYPQCDECQNREAIKRK